MAASALAKALPIEDTHPVNVMPEGARVDALPELATPGLPFSPPVILGRINDYGSGSALAEAELPYGIRTAEPLSAFSGNVIDLTGPYMKGKNSTSFLTTIPGPTADCIND